MNKMIKKETLELEEVKEKAKEIFQFANFTLGIGMCLCTITAIQFPAPWKINLILLPIWIFGLFYCGQSYQDLKKKLEKKEVKSFRCWYAKSVFTKAPILFFGYVFYTFILIYPYFPRTRVVVDFLAWIKHL